MSILGKLNWASQVVRGGRTFLRRLIDLSMKLKKNSHRTWLNREARADLEWWSKALTLFHGSTCFIQDLSPPDSDFKTDACRIGGGGWYKNDWFYINFKIDYPSFEHAHINCLELLTVLEGARRWGHHWRGQHIRVHSDNSSTVQAINKGTSHSPLFMLCLRQLFWISVLYDFRITAVHIKGEDNYLSDMISRIHMPKMAESFLNCMSPVNRHVNCFNHMSFSTFETTLLCLQGSEGLI